MSGLWLKEDLSNSNNLLLTNHHQIENTTYDDVLHNTKVNNTYKIVCTNSWQQTISDVQWIIKRGLVLSLFTFQKTLRS
jgi:hypothetical protein